MDFHISTLEHILETFLSEIRNGTCKIDDDDTKDIITIMRKIRETKLSKYQAYTHLNMGRSKFDELVSKGILPRGEKIVGFKELFWYESELDEAAKKYLENISAHK